MGKIDELALKFPNSYIENKFNNLIVYAKLLGWKVNAVFVHDDFIDITFKREFNVIRFNIYFSKNELVYMCCYKRFVSNDLEKFEVYNEWEFNQTWGKILEWI